MESSSCLELFKVLSEEDLKIFREVFTSNNKGMVKKFFSNSVIRDLWNPVMKQIKKEEDLFKNGPNQQLLLSYREVTRIVTIERKLELPEFWVKKFPADI